MRINYIFLFSFLFLYRYFLESLEQLEGKFVEKGFISSILSRRIKYIVTCVDVRLFF